LKYSFDVEGHLRSSTVWPGPLATRDAVRC
jgi:hypothetical protein